MPRTNTHQVWPHQQTKTFYNIKCQVAPAIYGIGAIAVAGAFMATPTVPPLVTNQVLGPVINLFSSFLKHWANKVVFVCGKSLQTELERVEQVFRSTTFRL
jgi:hypothetical protein